MDDLRGLSIPKVDWPVAHKSVNSEGLFEDGGVDFSIPRRLAFSVELAFVGALHQCLYPVDWRQVGCDGFGKRSCGFVSVECESWYFGIGAS